MGNDILSMEEQKVYNRGISDGLFNLNLEDINAIENHRQVFYFEGLIEGKEKRAVRESKKGFEKALNEAKMSYLRVFNSWVVNGEVEVAPDKREEYEEICESLNVVPYGLGKQR